MNELFLKIINMSISASWLVLAVLLLRLFLKKAPKWIGVLLWGIVAVRLICPFSFESAMSLIPSAETIPLNIEMDMAPAIDSGINAINNAVNPIISQSNTPANGASINPLQIIVGILESIWILGIVLSLLYTAVSYWRLCRKIGTAVLYKDNIFQSENVSSPFVLGIIKPRIYLPFNLSSESLKHVVAHEQAHIRRKDHWWKPLGFLVLTIHWFNPLMWLAYVLLCRDIELACDEKVIKELDADARADYSAALLSCSVSRRMIVACPVAFGEVSVKARIKSVLHYKKPAFWVIVVAIILCAVVAVCFLTDPSSDNHFSNPSSDNHLLKYYITSYLDESQQTEVNRAYNRENEAISVAVNFETTQGPSLIELVYGHKKNGIGNEWMYSDPVTLMLGESTTFTVPPDNHFSFTATAMDGSNGNVKFVFTEEKYKVGKEGIKSTGTLSLNDVIILSQKGYDLTWADFEKYDNVETGFRLYIRVYEINELFELRIGGAGPDSDPMYIYLALADDIDTKIDIRDGGVTEFISEHNSGSAETWDLIPMVMVNGTLYLDTGRESTVDARCGVMDGEITSQVNGNQKPTKDNQSNFGTGFGYQYGASEGTIELYMNDKWWIFATEEARQEIQFPSTETAFELNFAGNVSLDHKLELTADKPYWCVSIVNDGNYSIKAEIAGDVYTVDPGTSGNIYPDEAWTSGTYAISFSTSGAGGMEGHAICKISSVKFTEEEPLAWQHMFDPVKPENAENEKMGSKYYLTIGTEGVKSIELTMPNSSGGCVNADGSLFKKGERIWLENLDGYNDLRGVTITALDENGEIIWIASIPDGEENKGFTHLTQDDWTITNIK